LFLLTSPLPSGRKHSVDFRLFIWCSETDCHDCYITTPFGLFPSVLCSAEGFFLLAGELFERQLPGVCSLLSVIGGADTSCCFSGFVRDGCSC